MELDESQIAVALTMTIIGRLKKSSNRTKDDILKEWILTVEDLCWDEFEILIDENCAFEKAILFCVGFVSKTSLSGRKDFTFT